MTGIPRVEMTAEADQVELVAGLRRRRQHVPFLNVQTQNRHRVSLRLYSRSRRAGFSGLGGRSGLVGDMA
jgi:hypothetical protein